MSASSSSATAHSSCISHISPQLLKGVSHHLDALTDICSLLCSSPALHSLRFEIVANWLRRRHGGTDRALLAAVNAANVDSTQGDAATSIPTPEHQHNSRAIQLLQHLLSFPDAQLHATDAHQRSALHIASHDGQLEILAALLLRFPLGDRINAPDRQRRTPLHAACFRGHVPVVELLLAQPLTDVNARDNYGHTPLMLTCLPSARLSPDIRAAVAARLLAHDNIAVNATDSHNLYTALHLACELGWTEVVQLLLAHRSVDINLQVFEDWTPLHTACRHARLPIVGLLLARPNVVVTAVGGGGAGGDGGMSPLHSACSFMSGDSGRYADAAAVVQLLLQHPAVDPNARDAQQRTPLHCALASFAEQRWRAAATAKIQTTPVAAQRAEILTVAVLRQLVGHAAVEVNAVDEAGASPLHQACCFEWPDEESVGAATGDAVAMLLSRRDIQVNARTPTAPAPVGVTILQPLLPCTGNSTAAVLIDNQVPVLYPAAGPLAAAGSTAYGVNEELAGCTALHLACHHGKLAAVRLLLANGAEVNAATPSRGWTPLHAACKRGHLPVVRALLEHCTNGVQQDDGSGQQQCAMTVVHATMAQASGPVYAAQQ